MANEQEDAQSSSFFGVSDGREQSENQVNGPLFYEGKERGWFWYEDPAIEETPIEETPPLLPTEKITEAEHLVEKPKPKPGPKPLSSKWFRENMEKYRDAAVDDPTPQNVAFYMYLQRVMLDKAENFSQVAQTTVMTDPVLDENSRRPLATFGAFAMDDKSTKGIEKAAKKLAESAGLWFFYASTCEFCIKEAGVLRGLANAYGFKIMPIALDGLPLPGGDFKDFTIDRGQAKKMGVETTPALFLVKPGENGGALQLGQGLLSGDDILNRAITLSNQNGWLNQVDYNETLKVKPMTIDNQTIREVDENAMDDPAKLINTIRTNLRKQF